MGQASGLLKVFIFIFYPAFTKEKSWVYSFPPSFYALSIFYPWKDPRMRMWVIVLLSSFPPMILYPSPYLPVCMSLASACTCRHDLN
ncbi:hypothetical protein F4809DRAFT_603629, partial [Biscogniauxia mediterranea]